MSFSYATDELFMVFEYYVYIPNAPGRPGGILRASGSLHVLKKGSE